MFKQHLKGGSQFDVLGSTGYNNTFGLVPIQGRAHVGWNFESFDVEFFANYVSGYHNWSGNTVTPVTLVNGLPAGGGDVVKSNTTFDIHLSYTLSEGDWLGRYLPGTQFFVDMQNMFDKAPVLYNGNTGYDGYTGNPIGRLTTFGLRTKF